METNHLGYLSFALWASDYATLRKGWHPKLTTDGAGKTRTICLKGHSAPVAIVFSDGNNLECYRSWDELFSAHPEMLKQEGGE